MPGWAAGKHSAKVASAKSLRHALARIFQLNQLRDPDLVDVPITVTEVRVGTDLCDANVFIMPLGGEGGERVVAALGRATPFLRGCLAKEVRLRLVPQLTFRLDDSFANAARLDALLGRQPGLSPDSETADQPDEPDEPDDGA